ncbi:MAG: hypothetical protein LBL32_03110, partial [Holosporales bacterium]|nr:hypothetical protein [Holosporales bacterium]
MTIPKWGTIPDDVKAIDFGTAGIWLHSLAVTVNEDGPRAWVAGWFARREQYIIQLRNTWRPMDIYWDASKTDIIQQFPILEDPEAMGIHGGQDITTSDQIKYIITTFKDLEVAWSRDTEVLSPPVGEEIYNEEDGLGQDSLYALRKEYDRCRWAWRVLLDERGNPQKTEDEVLSDEDTGDQITIPSAPVYDDTREFNPPAILDGRVWEQGLRSVWDENAGELDCWEQEGDGQDMQPPQLNDENLAQLFTYYKNLSGSGNGSAAGTDFTKLTDTWQSLRARDLIPD